LFLGKIKAMSHLVTMCIDQLKNFLDDNVVDKGEPVEMKELFGRFTLDVIGMCAFGVQCDSLKDPNAEFVRAISKFNDMSTTMRLKLFTSLLIFGSPRLARLLNVRFMNQDTVQYVARLVLGQKQNRSTQQKKRVDFLQLMFDAQEGKIKSAESSKELFEKEAQLKDSQKDAEKSKIS